MVAPFSFLITTFYSCLKEEIASTPSASRGRGDTRASGTLLTDPLEDEINVDSVNRLLELLLAVNPQKDNIAKNEEIQDLFQQCNEMRPKVLELVVKFEKKKGICSSLVSMGFYHYLFLNFSKITEEFLQLNELFIKAKASYERLLAASIAPRAPPQQSDLSFSFLFFIFFC